MSHAASHYYSYRYVRQSAEYYFSLRSQREVSTLLTVLNKALTSADKKLLLGSSTTYSTEQFSKNSFHLMVCILRAAVISLLPAVLQCTSGYSEGLPTQNLKKSMEIVNFFKVAFS